MNDRLLPLIASQLAEATNRRLEDLIGEPVLDIPAGVPVDLPAHVEVLLATPMRMYAAPREQAAPTRWPFGLRWVQLASVGIDEYPDWFLGTVPVTNARGTSAEPIAEYVIAALFDGAKKLDEVWLKQPGDWRRGAQRPVLGRLAGSTLGLYGFGAIGQAVASRALALGMKVVALRRGSARFEIDGIERAQSLEDLAARSDHLVLAAPATPETRHAIGRSVLKAARPGLHLVNIARGSLVDDEALLEALADGRVARATLDVTDPEPLPEGHPYYGHPKVRLSPHISPSSPRGPQAVLAKFADNLGRLRAGAELVDRVDVSRGY